MALEHSRLLAASLTVALVGTSCSTPNNGATAGDKTAGAGESPAPSPTGQPNPQGQGQQGQGTTLDQQRRAALVAKYLEVAQSLRQDGKLDAALLELSKARDLSPENEQVLALINSIRQEQGAPGAGAIGYADEMLRQRQIAEDRARAEVTEK